MKTLSQRQKADTIVHFAKIMSRDPRGNARRVIVPGSEAKQYQVILRRYAGRVMTGECQCLTGGGPISCSGNVRIRGKNRTKPCYHVQTAVDAAIADKNLEGSWCWTLEDAERLNQMKKGIIVEVRSHQALELRAWVVLTL